MQLKTKAAILALSSSILAWAAPSFALDEKNLLEKLNAALSSNGIEVVPQSIEVDGDTVRFVNAKLKGSKFNDVTLPTITLDGVEDNNGGYTVASVTTEAFETAPDKEGMVFKVEAFSADTMHLPAVPDNKTIATTPYAEEAGLGGITMVKDGKVVAVVGPISSVTSANESNNAFTMTLDVDTFEFNILPGEPDNKEDPFKAMGIEKLNGSVNIDANWAMTDGDIDISNFVVNLDNLGTFNLTFGASGYTAEFVEELNRLNKLAPSPVDSGAAKTPEQEAAESEQSTQYMMGLMGLAQRMSIKGISLRFEDDSLTEKVLDYAGKKNGADAEQMKNTIKAMLPMMLAQWQLTSLQTTVPAAVNAFLDDPKSLTIKAVPPEPVAVPMLFGAIMNPASLVDILSVQVTSND